MKIPFRQGWIAITDFMYVKKLSKALFFVNKALAIDNQNRLYWKFCRINKQMNF
jgi:hypothetical protein